jgi:hypothetical protein
MDTCLSPSLCRTLALTCAGMLICSASAFAQGGSDPASLQPESWWKPWTWWNDEIQEAVQGAKAEAIRDLARISSEARRQLRETFEAPLFIMSLVVLVGTLYGQVLAERVRAYAVARFSIPPEVQKRWATRAFIGCALLVCLLTWVFPHFGPARKPVLVLVAGATYVFYVRLLPVIATDQVALRKIAVGQIKALGTLALLILVMMQLLSDGGLFGMGVGSSPS